MTRIAGEPTFPWLRRLLSSGDPFTVDDPARRGRALAAGVAHRARTGGLPGRRRDRSRPSAESRRRRAPEQRRPAPADPVELGDRLVERLRECGHDFVLDVVLDLLSRESSDTGGHSMPLGARHHGVQGVIWRGPYDLDPLFVQCHRIGPGRSVDVSALRELTAVMARQPTNNGCVVSTGGFTPEAATYAVGLGARARLRLIDQAELGRLMVKHARGVRPTVALDIEESFFEEG